MTSILFLLLLVVFFVSISWAVDPEDATDAQPKDLTRVSHVTMKRIKVRLDQVVMEPERYSHRRSQAFKEENLQSLMDSLVLEGMQVPIEGFFDDQGRFVVVKGHRRVRAHQLLVGQHKPGFLDEMELEAVEVANASPQDLLCRSIGDNVARLNYDRIERIDAAKRLYDQRVEETRAAVTLGVSVKSYRRDLLIARHPYMFQHIIDGSIEASGALTLLEAAEEHKRLDEVKEDFDAWVAQQKHLIRQKEKSLAAGQKMSAAEKLVKKRLEKHLLEHWGKLIKQGKRFDDDAEWDYAAHLDLEKRQLRISAVTLDVDKASPEDLAKVASRLSLCSKQLMPILKKRLADHQVDQVAEQPPWDWEYLAEVGGQELAEHLKQRQEKAKEEKVDGTDEPQEIPEERQETDLADEIELPQEAVDKAEPVELGKQQAKVEEGPPAKKVGDAGTTVPKQPDAKAEKPFSGKKPQATDKRKDSR